MINKRILVVDDEPDVIFTLKIVLEENEFKVDSFTDPLLALQNFIEQDSMYDMIILDIKIPEMNGFELYRQIKKIVHRVKMYFLTASEMYYAAYEDMFN